VSRSDSAVADETEYECGMESLHDSSSHLEPCKRALSHVYTNLDLTSQVHLAQQAARKSDSNTQPRLRQRLVLDRTSSRIRHEDGKTSPPF